MDKAFHPTSIQSDEAFHDGVETCDWFRESLDAARSTMRQNTGRLERAIYSTKGFEALGNRLVDIAQEHRIPLSMVVFDYTDLQEAQKIYSRRTFQLMFDHLINQLFELAGKKGMVSHTGRVEFTVMLPGLNLEQAKAAIERCMGNPARIEFTEGHLEILLIPDVEVALAGPDIERARDLHDKLRHDLLGARDYDRLRLASLTREHEWHSRPMELCTLPNDSKPVPLPLLPATMPAPLIHP